MTVLTRYWCHELVTLTVANKGFDLTNIITKLFLSTAFGIRARRLFSVMKNMEHGRSRHVDWD